MGGKTTYWGIILWIQVGDKWGEWSVHIFLLCVWVGGGLEEVYGYEYKSTVIRHKNHINIWEISAQISGWTCAVCVRACSLSLIKHLSLYAKTHHNSIKPIPPAPPHPSAYFVFTLCGKQAAVYSFLSSSQSTLGNKKTTTFPSVLTPTLTAKEAAAAVGGSELNSGLRKSKRADRQEPVGIFLFCFFYSQTISPVPESRHIQSQETPCYSVNWGQNSCTFSLFVGSFELNPKQGKKNKKLPHSGAKKVCFWY